MILHPLLLHRYIVRRYDRTIDGRLIGDPSRCGSVVTRLHASHDVFSLVVPAHKHRKRERIFCYSIPLLAMNKVDTP